MRAGTKSNDKKQVREHYDRMSPYERPLLLTTIKRFVSTKRKRFNSR